MPGSPTQPASAHPQVCSRAVTHPLGAGASLPAGVEQAQGDMGEQSLVLCHHSQPRRAFPSRVKGTPRIVPALKGALEGARSRGFRKAWCWASALKPLVVGPRNWKQGVTVPQAVGLRRRGGRGVLPREGSSGRASQELRSEGAPGRGPRRSKAWAPPHDRGQPWEARVHSLIWEGMDPLLGLPGQWLGGTGSTSSGQSLALWGPWPPYLLQVDRNLPGEAV